VVETGVTGHIPGALTRALIMGLEHSQIDVPIGEVVAGSGLAYFLQTEHLLIGAEQYCSSPARGEEMERWI
jgi:hypothetical protein